MRNLFKKRTQHVELKITYKDGRWVAWNIKRNGKKGFSYHFSYFYKWYFGREQSENYMFKSTTSEQLIKRSDILTFSVGFIEVKE